MWHSVAYTKLCWQFIVEIAEIPNVLHNHRCSKFILVPIVLIIQIGFWLPFLEEVKPAVSINSLVQH